MGVIRDEIRQDAHEPPQDRGSPTSDLFPNDPFANRFDLDDPWGSFERVQQGLSVLTALKTLL